MTHPKGIHLSTALNLLWVYKIKVYHTYSIDPSQTKAKHGPTSKKMSSPLWLKTSHLSPQKFISLAPRFPKSKPEGPCFWRRATTSCPPPLCPRSRPWAPRPVAGRAASSRRSRRRRGGRCRWSWKMLPLLGILQFFFQDIFYNIYI